jgi:hypothetical protein
LAQGHIQLHQGFQNKQKPEALNSKKDPSSETFVEKLATEQKNTQNPSLPGK